MAIELLEGTIITLDAHMTDLLELYTAQHNLWLREGLKGRECPCEPQEATMDDIGRELLTGFLHDWAAQQRETPCAWCGGTGSKHPTHPMFCGTCVQAMLRGQEEARRDLCAPVTELPPLTRRRKAVR